MTAAAAIDAALAELRASLFARPRQIPCKYFYDDRGSALFERITELPEYYPTRIERALIEANAARLIDAGDWGDFVELGSGAAQKTLALLEEAARRGRTPRYVAVDISAHALERTRQILRGVDVRGVLADYSRPLELPARIDRRPRLVLFLGGTIGNDEDDDAVALLSRVRARIEPGDGLLLGAMLPTDPAVIEAAYDDAQGVTAEFNRNILRAVNDLALSRFDPEAFEHRAPYLVHEQRIEMWLRSPRAQVIELGRIGGVLRLEAGEAIRTEISRRFTRAQVERLLALSGFTPQAWLESPDGRFGLGLGLASGAPAPALR